MVHNLIAFMLAATLLTLTPGLDTALVLRTAAAEGRQQAMRAALGINAGCLVWGAVIALGLGALLAVSTTLFTLFKLCGAAYLCWLGLHMLLRPRTHFASNASDDTLKSSHIGWGMKGLLSNVLNPKVGIFYVSFLPQFIPAQHSFVGWTLILVMLHIGINLTWFMLLIHATRPLTQLLRRANVIKWLDRVTGGLFLFFAAHLAFGRR
ncbi:LysE family translocator [Zymobacter palmae]|uniref:Putative threonine effluxprotein n=1 Tax=Zymobacter palmae TaxID=33074 RepID=A0A348HEF8_9GAMM|nr:LysE family translocator [Zymobacter palmae]BBG30010.1 putative threonine effluxprotein [Zymobacter palmae]